MTPLQAAAEHLVKLWKDGKIAAQGHAGVTVELTKAMTDLNEAVRFEQSASSQTFMELFC